MDNSEPMPSSASDATLTGGSPSRVTSSSKLNDLQKPDNIDSDPKVVSTMNNDPRSTGSHTANQLGTRISRVTSEKLAHAVPVHDIKGTMNELKRQATLGESPYPGKGTQDEPYIVDWLPGEKANPYNWSRGYKWLFTLAAALTTLCIAFASSCYTGAALFMEEHFGVSEEVVILGVSLFVLGFGLGPLLWSPLSEMKGRRLAFLVSYGPFALFHLGGARATNVESIIITRFFAGAFGSSMLTNAGGCIADVWNSQERGLATVLFALAPFLGPVIGPIVGGFAGQSSMGWRSVFWIMFVFSCVMYIVGFIFLPESYAPVLVRRRAAELQKASAAEGGPVVYYIGKYDIHHKSNAEILKVNLIRPFQILFLEPIVLLLSIYVAIIYATLYLFFTAFPIVFQTPEPAGYGWSAGVGGLSFIGMGVGMVIGVMLTPISNKIYLKAAAKSPTGRAPPEARLPLACVGACMLPIGLFWFAWTARPSVHWIVPCIAAAPFGAGMLLVFTSVIGYIIDAYLMYAASALAANAVLRSVLGAVFPLFATYMYRNLGNEWAGTLVAFLSLVCTPMPFAFYYYGAALRKRSKYAPDLPAITAPAADNEKPVVKERQPSINSALEPEFGLGAGENTGDQPLEDFEEPIDHQSPLEMQTTNTKATTGHLAA